MQYSNLYILRSDGQFSEHSQTIEVDVDVKMFTSSVSGTARWGQTIGTSGMSDCHGLLVVNKQGAVLFHHLCNDSSFNIPDQYNTPDKQIFRLYGSKYNRDRGPLSGRSDYAFFLSPRGPIAFYASQYLGNPTPPPSPKPAARSDLQGSGEYTDIDWSKYGVS